MGIMAWIVYDSDNDGNISNDNNNSAINNITTDDDSANL